jgi:hypothetical protein
MWSDEKNRLKQETLKALITTKTHQVSLIVPFCILILNEKNFLAEIHSSDRYSINDEPGPSAS